MSDVPDLPNPKKFTVTVFATVTLNTYTEQESAMTVRRTIMNSLPKDSVEHLHVESGETALIFRRGNMTHDQYRHIE